MDAFYTPTSLFPGASVALLCPSSPVSAQRREAAARAVRALGLHPVLFPSAFAARGHLAGEDALRAEDLNRAFADPSIHGILALRGGFGAHRVLPLLDWDAIRTHPKYFGGYSDITALHTALNQRCGFVTYHTIMPAANDDYPLDEYSMDFLCRALFGTLHGPLENPPGQALLPLAGGVAEGPLCGGNLSVIAASIGTPFQLDTAGKILFLEEVKEPNHRIDALLTQLRNAGLFAECVGILLGAFTPPAPPSETESLSLEEIWTDLLPSHIPIMANLACGHVLPSMALPMGGICRMDADRRTLTLLTKGR
ncbi:MAG: LD-carboxypeptidase [Oscillospiraceae bacterium]|nr:LD-carboxypeptidase [Oscillospiraceae bacterium]